MNIGKLIVCGNQIGNLYDLPSEAVRAIKETNSIICDTKARFINEILNPLEIDASTKNLLAFEPYLDNTELVIDFAKDIMNTGEDVVFICDAGMPGVSDWGTQIVEAMHNADLPIRLIPGPSILTTAIAASGIVAQSERLFYAGLMDQGEDEITETILNTMPLRPCLVLVDHPENMGNVIEIVDKIYKSPKMSLCVNLTMPDQKIIRGNGSDVLSAYNTLADLDCFMTLVVDGSRT